MARVEATLSNGLRLLTIRDASEPLVSLRAITLGGVCAERPGLGGSAWLLAAVMNRGAGGRSADEVAREIESLAAHVDATSGRASCAVRLTTLTETFESAWAIFVDTLLRPNLEEADLTREAALQVQHLVNLADRPATLTIRRMLALLFAGHPYGRSVLGTRESVPAIGCADLAGLHRVIWGRPRETVLVTVGDVDPDRLAADAEAALTEPGDGPAVALPEVAPARWPTERIEERLPGTGEQAHIAIGLGGLAHRDPDRAALDVLLTVLSGQGGRLFLELRDKQSLAYSVTASSFEGYEPGYIVAYMGTSPEKVPDGLAGLEAALARLCDERVSAPELERARNYIVGTYDVGLQRRGARAATLAYDLLFEAPVANLTDYPERAMAVTADDVRAVAQRLLDPAHSVVCVLDPSLKEE